MVAARAAGRDGWPGAVTAGSSAGHERPADQRIVLLAMLEDALSTFEAL
jgi:hypothetical protein